MLSESPDALAREARERGDAVNGAILFAQQNLACANCHAEGASDRIGTDLTRTRPPNDAHLIDAILRPSKEIAKGYSSVNILTVDGKIENGRIVSQNEQTTTIRRLKPPYERVVLATESIDQIRENNASAMPEGFANQFVSRQQFLDLTRYVMDIAGTQTAADQTVGHGTAKLHDRIAGLALIDHYGCVNCHTTAMMDPNSLPTVPTKSGPDLSNVASRLAPDYLRRFISNPHQTKPGTSMPDVMAHLPHDTKSMAVPAILQYLNSLSNESFKHIDIDDKAAQRGRILFHEIGCVACHQPRDETGKEILKDESVPLGTLAQKYSVASLADFLQHPHQVRPHGRMPNMNLSHWESLDLANYLLVSGPPPTSAPDERTVPAIVERGRRIFHRFGCGNCHTPNTPADLPKQSLPPFAHLEPEKGCLNPTTNNTPRYPLDDDERNLIREAIRQRHSDLTNQDQIMLSMQTLRCFSCHSRDRLGGIPETRDLYFHTANENLGPQGRIPPTLSGVGGKLKPKWLRSVLVSGKSIRPYMKTRMPQFGAENVEHLVSLFATVDPKPSIEVTEVDDAKEARKVGTELVGNQGLNCIACHTFQHKPFQTMPAVDLTEMGERLHGEWFYQYMLSPQSLSPNTVMPSFWPGGKAIRQEIAEGNTTKQLDALWHYLSYGRQAPTPRGLQRKPIEVLASKDRAVMLRRSYREIGKRGIGVGYPAGVNLAFDAEQMRLATLWKGKFAEASGVWYGQGHGVVRPLGRDVIQFHKGPDLDDRHSPWIVDQGRPPQHQFTGYFLDEYDRPTFTYRFGDIEVEDYFFDARVPINQPATNHQCRLDRITRFHAANQSAGLRFRVASGNQIITSSDNQFVVDGKLTITLATDLDATVVCNPNDCDLFVNLDLPTGKSTLEVSYRW